MIDKVEGKPGVSKMRFGREQIKVFTSTPSLSITFSLPKAMLKPLLEGLFGLFTESSGENPYLMWAISKVLSVSQMDAAPYISMSVQMIGKKLEAIYQHPHDGRFGHYLFESVSSLLSFSLLPLHVNTDF